MTPKLTWSNLKSMPHIWQARHYKRTESYVSFWLSESIDHEWHAEVNWAREDQDNKQRFISLVDEKLEGVRDPVDAMVRCEQRVAEVLRAEFGELLK